MKFRRRSILMLFLAVVFGAVAYVGALNSIAAEEKRIEAMNFRIYSTFGLPSEFNNWDYLLYGSLILCLSCGTVAVWLRKD